MERIHPTHWLAMLASRHQDLPPGSLTRNIQAIARRLGVWAPDGRPHVGPLSDHWLRELNAESDKRGLE